MYDFMVQLCQTSLVMSLAGLAFTAVRRILGERYCAAGRRMTWLVIFAGFLCIVKPSLGGRYLCEAPALAPALSHAYTSSGENVAAVLVRLLWVIWLMGLLVCVGFAFARHREFMIRVRRLSACASAEEMSALRELWQSCLKQCQIRRPIPLLIVPGLSSPMAAGVWRPMLLLPPETLKNEKLHLILLHEASHIRAGDLWAEVLCQAVTALHWFNPLCRRFARQFEADMESACDERVLAQVGRQHRKEYCAAILQVVREQAGLSTAFSTHFAARPSQLKRRLEAIMTGRRQRMFAGVAACLLAFTLCSGSVVSMNLFGLTGDRGLWTGLSWTDEGEMLTTYPLNLDTSAYPGESQEMSSARADERQTPSGSYYETVFPDRDVEETDAVMTTMAPTGPDVQETTFRDPRY